MGKYIDELEKKVDAKILRLESKEIKEVPKGKFIKAVLILLAYIGLSRFSGIIGTIFLAVTVPKYICRTVIPTVRKNRLKFLKKTKKGIIKIRIAKGKTKKIKVKISEKVSKIRTNIKGNETSYFSKFKAYSVKKWNKIKLYRAEVQGKKTSFTTYSLSKEEIIQDNLTLGPEYVKYSEEMKKRNYVLKK